MDNLSAVRMLQKRIPDVANPRLLRWKILLGAYHFTVEHRPASMHSNCDALSRCPDRRSPPNEDDVSTAEREVIAGIYYISQDCPPEGRLELPEALAPGAVARATKADPILREVLHYVHKGWPSACPRDALRPYFRHRHALSIVGDCLMYGDRVVLPQVFEPVAHQLIQDLHVGREKAFALCRLYLWFPTWRRVVKHAVDSCESCQQTRAHPPRRKQATWPSAGRWERLHVDFGEIDRRSFFVIMDAGTGYVVADWTSGQSSADAIRVLRNAFRTHGLCSVLVSNNATGLDSQEFRCFLRRRSIVLLHSAPYSPPSNGAGEMAVKLVKLHYKRLPSGPDRLVDAVADICMVPRSDGLSPAARLMGRQPALNLAQLRPRRKFECSPSTVQYQPRQLVYYPLHRRGAPKWGRGTVVKTIGNVRCEILCEEGHNVVRHCSQIMPRVGDEDDETAELRERMRGRGATFRGSTQPRRPGTLSAEDEARLLESPEDSRDVSISHDSDTLSSSSTSSYSSDSVDFTDDDLALPDTALDPERAAWEDPERSVPGVTVATGLSAAAA